MAKWVSKNLIAENAIQPANRTLSEAARNASISTKLNFSAPSTLIIHPQLARSNSFRLILRWNQLPRSGSSCVGQESSLACRLVPGILEIRQAEGWGVFVWPDSRSGPGFKQNGRVRAWQIGRLQAAAAARYTQDLEWSNGTGMRHLRQRPAVW